MKPKTEPLAYRLAPRNLAEYVGQTHLLAPGRLLRRMIEADQLRSMILYGPPGTGKTSLARVIAASTQLPFKRLNAVTAGVADLKRLIEDAKNPLLTPEGRIVLFIDEIHRFNKLQQDALLPAVEEGVVVLIGATTENPFFEVNKALISRTTVFQLNALSEEEVGQLLDRALTDERGYASADVILDPKARRFLANRANGDARIALQALELAITSTPPNTDGTILIDLSVAEDCIQKRSTAFDATGENHYDTISAFIKSMRGSDPDAALYYLALALHGGEDIEFLARRILICAAEDVGMANPTALLVAEAAYSGVARVGMPEARILLAEAAVFVATSPKSNASYLGMDAALAYIREHPTGEIPYPLRNAPTEGMKELGYHDGYLYAHDFPGAFVLQQYLPDSAFGQHFYNPTEYGYEGRNVRERFLAQREEREEAYRDGRLAQKARPGFVEGKRSREERPDRKGPQKLGGPQL